MEFSIKLHTIKSGWSIGFIEGLQKVSEYDQEIPQSQTPVIISPKILYFFLQRSILSKQIVQILMICSMMLHIIWIFTVSQSTHLRVSGLQRVNLNSSIHKTGMTRKYGLSQSSHFPLNLIKGLAI